MGRPRKLTKAKRAEFLEQLEKSPYITVAARLVEVSVNTVRRAMAEDPVFTQAVKDARLLALDKVAHSLQRDVALEHATFDQRLRYLQSVHPMFKKQELDVSVLTQRKGKRSRHD